MRLLIARTNNFPLYQRFYKTMKTTILTLCAVGALASVLFASVYADSMATPSSPSAPETAAPKSTYEVLSRHDTEAVFSGTREHRCMGRTTLCPDRCGHSGTLAAFKIESYNAYEKPGKYGDPKTSEFLFMLKSSTGKSDVSKDIADLVRQLKPGEKVHLVWEHIYVSDPNGGHYPKRVVRKLEKR